MKKLTLSGFMTLVLLSTAACVPANHPSVRDASDARTKTTKHTGSNPPLFLRDDSSLDYDVDGYINISGKNHIVEYMKDHMVGCWYIVIDGNAPIRLLDGDDRPVCDDNRGGAR